MAAAAPAFLFLSPPGKLPGKPKPSPNRKQPCASSSSSSSSSSSPSLAEQLEPLSRTLLHGKPTPTEHAPGPTWPLLRDLRALPDAADLAPTLHAFFPPSSPPSASDALLLLNYLHPSWRKSLSLLAWLRALPAFPLDTILFNVTLKSLRAARQWPHAEGLALDMLASAVPLDNITYSTLITTARRCRQFDKALHWFERMYTSDGVLPDEVTYSAILDVYAQLRMKEEVLALFDRARGSGWKPDHVAFAVLAKMFGEAGDYDGIQFVFREMREVGIKPNIFVYNALLEALGKTGKPGLARNLFDEMTSEGVEPNARTLTALAKIYGRARWGRDALQLWEQMRQKKLPADNILCNTLLSMCADVGLVGEAEQLFSDMKDPDQGDVPKPDKWSYTAMINIYGSSGDADRALQLFAEMVECGIEPNIMSYTIVIQCLGKAGRIRDAVEVLETGMSNGLEPDDRLCGCLLSVVALSSGEETEMVLACLEKVRSDLVKLIRMLGDAGVGADDLTVKLKGILNAVAPEVRRPYCNCLIDICHNHGYPSERAVELFRLARLYGLYSKIHTKKEEEWSLDLRSLSVGAAKTAFDEWMKTISEHKEGLPQTFSVYTGSSTHKFAQGLAAAFAAHLEQLEAPFHASESQLGSFISSRDDLVSCSSFRSTKQHPPEIADRQDKMILAVLFSNSDGNILIERFHGVPAEERLHWRSFLVKLGAENLKGAKNEELLVASHKSVSIVYTMIGDVCLYIVGKDEYDELALAEVIFAITSAVKDVCGKPPTERLFLDKYGRICLCLDEIVWKGLLENTEKDRVRRLIRLKPPVEP
uniref:Smr domain-containing protein n=1 Tax=Oryza brachyantha TaxID=4533 RepID=J3LUY1_ORYBR